MMISKRLETIVSMIEPCGVLADIGCDHAYVSIRAVQDQKAAHVIAADAAKGPLETARRNCREAGTEASTEFILSDGFGGISEESGIECAVIAGMGGILISRILQDAKLGRFPELRQLILGPQSDQDLVRKTIQQTGIFQIMRELWVLDEGKYYVLLDVRKSPERTGKEPWSEAEYFYGKNPDPGTMDVYLDYLSARRRALYDAYESSRKGSPEKNYEKTCGLKYRIELVETAILKAGGRI